jgi:hypothetical protein
MPFRLTDPFLRLRLAVQRARIDVCRVSQAIDGRAREGKASQLPRLQQTITWQSRIQS